MGAMLERVRLTMPQDKPGKMTRQEIADLLAFMLRSNKFPAGKSELARQADMLNGISSSRRSKLQLPARQLRTDSRGFRL